MHFALYNGYFPTLDLFEMLFPLKLMAPLFPNVLVCAPLHVAPSDSVASSILNALCLLAITLISFVFPRVRAYKRKKLDELL